MKGILCVLLLAAAACLASCGAGSAGGGTDFGAGGLLDSETTIFDSADVTDDGDGIVVTADVYVNKNDAALLYVELGEDATAEVTYTLEQEKGRMGLEFCSPSGDLTQLADLDGDLQGGQDVNMQKGINVFCIREEGEAQYQIRLAVKGLEPENILGCGLGEPK